MVPTIISLFPVIVLFNLQQTLPLPTPVSSTTILFPRTLETWSYIDTTHIDSGWYTLSVRSIERADDQFASPVIYAINNLPLTTPVNLYDTILANISVFVAESVRFSLGNAFLNTWRPTRITLVPTATPTQLSLYSVNTSTAQTLANSSAICRNLPYLVFENNATSTPIPFTNSTANVVIVYGFTQDDTYATIPLVYVNTLQVGNVTFTLTPSCTMFSISLSSDIQITSDDRVSLVSDVLWTIQRIEIGTQCNIDLPYVLYT